jgi:hypothetical protein
MTFRTQLNQIPTKLLQTVATVQIIQYIKKFKKADRTNCTAAPVSKTGKLRPMPD